MSRGRMRVRAERGDPGPAGDYLRSQSVRANEATVPLGRTALETPIRAV